VIYVDVGSSNKDLSTILASPHNLKIVSKVVEVLRCRSQNVLVWWIWSKILLGSYVRHNEILAVRWVAVRLSSPSEKVEVVIITVGISED